MNYKYIITLFLFIFLLGCDQSTSIKYKKNNIYGEKRYKNTGFTLVYNKDIDYVKKLDNRSLNIFHKFLNKKDLVKISNPKNGKFLIANVSSNKEVFSDFYNSIISERIAETLELDLSEPLIEIVLVSKNSTFVAKKAKTFEDEKKIADKAPIDGIQIKDLNLSTKKEIKTKKKDFSYIIKVADFYYLNTAKLMITRIKNESSIKNAKIIKLSETNYRVLIGPFNDIKSIQKAFEKMKSLNFENLEIINNV